MRVDEGTDGVFMLTLGDGQNRIDADFLAAWNDGLDGVEAASEAKALLTTGAGRFYSNGYDLDWMASRPKTERRDFIAQHEALLARLLLFPIPTAAVLNGHVVGGAALLALAHDVRVMREDRGFFCLPEIDAGIAFREGMAALLRCKLSPAGLRDSALAGARIAAARALELALIDEYASAEQLIERAKLRLAPLVGKPRKSFAAMKRSLYGDVVRLLEEATPRAPRGRRGPPL